MPNLTIGGTKLNRINSAKVEILHGDAREARQIPIHQFVIQLPLDHEVMLAEWALAPQDPKRWKKVVLETTDRSKTVNHTWTLQKAYVHRYLEHEYPEGSSGPNDQGNYVELTIRGTLIHANTAHDGKNILDVKTGPAEALPS